MDHNKKISKAAGVVGAMTLVSRVFGFIRDVVIAMMFGSSMAADAFFLAFRIPNLQRRLLGEGAVSSAFIPVFSEYRNSRGDQEAWTLATNLFNMLLIFLVVMAGLIFLLAPLVITVFAPGFIDEPDKFELTVKLTRWMTPFLICIGLASLFMGILNTFKVFALPAATPVLLNISMITCALLLSPYFDEPIFALAVGVLAGGILQFSVQVPAVIRRGFKWTLSLNWKHPGVVRIGKLIVPAILGLAVYEVNIMVDTLLASLLPPGSISYLYYANRLVQLPLGVFGVALGVALLPTLSDQAARREFPALLKTLGFGIRLILFITVPATVGLILLRFPIIHTLWERGEFSRTTTEGTALALLYYSLGLCAFAGIKVVVTAFYSFQDTKTPAKIAIASMILNIALCLIFMKPLKHGGLALATSLSAMFNVLCLLYVLRTRFGRIGGRKLLVSLGQLVFASAVMGIAVYFFKQTFFDPHDPLPKKLLVLGSCIALGTATFSFISFWIKNEELIFIKEWIGQKRLTPDKTQIDFGED